MFGGRKSTRNNVFAQHTAMGRGGSLETSADYYYNLVFLKKTPLSWCGRASKILSSIPIKEQAVLRFDADFFSA